MPSRPQLLNHTNLEALFSRRHARSYIALVLFCFEATSTHFCSVRLQSGASPAQDSGTHVRSVEFFCHSRARVWRARGIPNCAGGRGEGPGFFARQPRARMTAREIEQDWNCHYDSRRLKIGQVIDLPNRSVPVFERTGVLSMRFYIRIPRLNPTGSLNEYRVAPTESFVM